jgi:hypothetical protein
LLFIKTTDRGVDGMSQGEGAKVYEKIEGTQRLMELGIPLEVLIQTASDIALHRGNVDEYCPVQAPGQVGWIGGVRAFRLGLVNVGYKLNNTGGFSSVVSGDGKYEFFIMSASRAAGRYKPGSKPRSKAPRGIQTIKRIEENQLSFPLDQLLVAPDTAEDGTREHWCFLYNVTKAMIYSEFSKPTGVDDRGFVAEWSERIILDPIPIASETVNVGENEDAPKIDVPVTLRNKGLDGVQAGKTNTGKRAKGSN